MFVKIQKYFFTTLKQKKGKEGILPKGGEGKINIFYSVRRKGEEDETTYVSSKTDYLMEYEVDDKLKSNVSINFRTDTSCCHHDYRLSHVIKSDTM